MKRCADIAKELGAEVFVLDAGWFGSKDWGRELGDWTPNPTAFPLGLEKLANCVRSQGMKFGMWVEIENLGIDSKTFHAHPDWCLHYSGKPLVIYDRYQLDFAKPEVSRWARSVIDRFVHDYGIEWLKIDYNIDISDRFDQPGESGREDGVLYQHVVNYYRWLDEVRAAHPQLTIENCSSGGARLDLGIIAHTHTTWLPDNVAPQAEAQLGYGCTVEFIPEICNHWMVGDKDNGDVLPTDKPGWWDFMFRIPMNGQYGISSRMFDWSSALRERAAANIMLYKRIRPVIMGADVYHLSAEPDHEDPTGWMAIQYVSPDANRSVVMAYRLADSETGRVFKLRGLNEARAYRVSIDEAAASTRNGQDLARAGLRVDLDEAWRAAVVELSSAQ